MGLITYLPTFKGFDLVFTIVNRSSKYVTFIPCKSSCTAPDLARMFYNHIVCKFGMPQNIISDKDSRFMSKFWWALMRLLQCTLAISSGYHPQTNNQSKCFHHSVEQILPCYVTSSQQNWVVSLASAVFSLNSTVFVAHGKSPFIVLFGREPTLPLDLAMAKLSNCTVQAVSDFITCQEKNFSDFCNALAKSNESIAHSSDKHYRYITFYAGDLVYINTTHFSLAPGLSRKLDPKWLGSILIEQVIYLVAYHISLPKEYGYIHPVFHISSLYEHYKPPPSFPPPIFPVADNFSSEYEVEDILA